VVKRKILLVDDEEDIIETVGTMLRLRGYDVITAFDGSEGLAKARSERPDLILLDIIMPVMDGMDVCAKLKADKATIRIPIIMFSVLAENLAIVKAHKAGANDYVVKPFNLSALLNKMNRLITNKQD